MNNIAVGGQYFPIPRDHCILKVLKKSSDIVEKNHALDIIGGFDDAGYFGMGKAVGEVLYIL